MEAATEERRKIVEEEKSRSSKKFQFPLPRPHPAPSTENVLKYFSCILFVSGLFCACVCNSFGVVTYFPAAHTEKEADQVGLLLLLELFDILEGTHFCYSMATTTANVSFTKDGLIIHSLMEKEELE